MKQRPKSTNKEYKCKYCQQTFANADSERLHKKSCQSKIAATISHKTSKPKSCVICSSTFVSQSSLTRHIQEVHGKLKKFLCIYCGKEFNRKYHLKNHIDEFHDVLAIHQDDESKFTLKVINPTREHNVVMCKLNQEDMISIGETGTHFSNFIHYFEAVNCDAIEVRKFIGSDSRNDCQVICRKNGEIVAQDLIVLNVLKQC